MARTARKQTTAKIIQHPAGTGRRRFESAMSHSALPFWKRDAQFIDADIRHDLEPLRQRSRDAIKNVDHARHFLRMVETNVIGPRGVSVQSRAQRANGRTDQGAQRAIEEAWSQQSCCENYDAAGRLDRAAFDRLALRTIAQDGEVLIHIRPGEEIGDQRFTVQLLDPEILDIGYNGFEPSTGNPVRMGVETDHLGRPVAYHLNDAPDPIGRVYKPGKRERVEAFDRFGMRRMLHIYLPEWVGASRGIPWMSTALVRLKMLAGYEEAAITAARVSAVKSLVYTQHPDLAPDTENEDPGALTQALEPGQAEILPYGWDAKTLDYQWPNTDHGAFVKDCLRGVAAGLGVSYNGLAGDLESVNYSSLRQGALAERDLWMTLQDWWINAAVRPIFQTWLSWSVSMGMIRRPNGQPLDPRRLADLSHATYQARRWPWVDPAKDMAANAQAIQNRTRSISDIIREQGRDPDTVWTELATDLERLRALGLQPSSEPAPTTEPLIDEE